MNPTNNIPQLNEKQKKQYNTYRATGMPPERALSLSLQEADQKYSPLSTLGLDNIIFGKGGLINEVAGGITDAVTAKGAREKYEQDIANFGQEYADNKKPLTYGSKIGKGVGRAAFSFIETADDIFGEAVSDTLAPVLDDAVNSDVGQYLIKQATDFNDRNAGVPAEILDTLDLFGLTALPRKASVQSIRDSVLKNGKRMVDQGIDSSRGVSRLADYFKPTAPNNPIVTQIDEGFKGIQEILTTGTRAQDTAMIDRLDEIKTMIRNGNLEERILPMIDDFDLTPEEQNLFREYIKNIDEAVNQEGAADAVEAYLTGALDNIDSAAAGAVSITERLSDTAIDRTLKTVENIKAVPGAIADRVKTANDRRIVRIATTNTDEALNNILQLYKTGIVPGVKKKNKTIATINQIDEAVKRVVPELAKKYDVEDLEDFANVISLEKKAIFSQIDEGLQAAGKAGRDLDLQPIIDELDKLLTSERASFSSPLRKAIERAKKELVVETPGGDIVVKKISASGAQDLIADLNAALQPQFRGARTNADDVVDFLVVNNLRKLTDDLVDDLGSGSFKDLKAQYADLKKLEDDVVHRAVFEAQKGNGLSSSIADVSSAADLAAGAFSPAFLARSAGGFITKEVTKALNDKNELVRQMFLYGRNVDAPVRRGGARINPADEAIQKSEATGSGIEISEDSKAALNLNDVDLKTDIDFKAPFTAASDQIELFGVKMPLNKVEGEILPNLRLYAQNFLTKGGNRQANQPLAAFRPNLRSGSQKEIQFSTQRNQTTERVIATMFHETGHAIDDAKKITGIGSEFRKAANEGEGMKLVMERAMRSFKSAIDSYDLTEADIKSILRGQSVSIGNNKRIGGQLKTGKYFKQYDEIFAEAYAMYRLNPKQLEELAPNIYQQIDNLVK
jgi:hypothetical protein